MGDVTEEQAEKDKETIWKIIDNEHTKLPEKAEETDEDKTTRLLLARIDRRKMKPKVEQDGDKLLVDFNPQIDPDLEGL